MKRFFSFPNPVNEVTARVTAGGTARYAADVPHAIRNADEQVARALLVVMT